VPTPRTPETNEPDHKLIELFTQAQAVLDQLPDGIDVRRLEVYALTNRFNRILLATGYHDYADFLVKGLDHKD